MVKQLGITYRDNAQHTRVYLDGKHVGDIMQRMGGMWFYQPKTGGKSDAGDNMPSRNAVKKSLESPADESQ